MSAIVIFDVYETKENEKKTIHEMSSIVGDCVVRHGIYIHDVLRTTTFDVDKKASWKIYVDPFDPRNTLVDQDHGAWLNLYGFEKRPDEYVKVSNLNI